MRDDEHTSENVIAVSFVEEANAYEALARLKELEAKGAIALRDAAVALGEEDGKIEQKDQFSHNGTTVTPSGGLLGLLVGVLGGPLGLLLGGATGLLVGSLSGDDTAQTESVLATSPSRSRSDPPRPAGRCIG
jgi:uncharacterized membrane protein